MREIDSITRAGAGVKFIFGRELVAKGKYFGR